MIFKVHVNPNYSWILYIQSHASCKHRRSGCFERCWSLLASNSSSALSPAINRRLCFQSRNKSLLSAGLLLLADSPQDFSAPHEVGTGSLTKMLLSTHWCCKEMREEGKGLKSLLTGGECWCHWAQSPGITSLYFILHLKCNLQTHENGMSEAKIYYWVWAFISVYCIDIANRFHIHEIITMIMNFV